MHYMEITQNWMNLQLKFQINPLIGPLDMSNTICTYSVDRQRNFNTFVLLQTY